jgi:hypothetical protein
MKNFETIKDDWTNQRCKPNVMPFAGLINKPDNISISDFTYENFTFCSQDILKNILGYAIQPIVYLIKNISGLFNEIMNSQQFIRIMLSSIRSNITSASQTVLNQFNKN